LGWGKKTSELVIQFQEPALDPLYEQTLGKRWLSQRADTSWSAITKIFEEERAQDPKRGAPFFYQILSSAGFRPRSTETFPLSREIIFSFEEELDLQALQNILAQYSLKHSLRDRQAIALIAQRWNQTGLSEKEKSEIVSELRVRFTRSISP
jgi:hypothetical protein